MRAKMVGRVAGLGMRGFTLIEIMVVVVVLGILAAAIIPNIAGKDRDAKVSKAQSDIQTMVTLIENFRLDMGRYPYPEEGLAVLREPPQDDPNGKWKGPYTTRPIPEDPWNQPYVYEVPAPNGIDAYGIVSYGEDGQPGGTEYARDITSWENYGQDDAGY